MNPSEQFILESRKNVESMGNDQALQKLTLEWFKSSAPHKYTYNFSWMGRPIIQMPQDFCAMQEIIWSVQPDLIIETGIAHGGSLVFSASMLALLDMVDAINSGSTIDPRQSRRKVLGIDIDIRAHNRAAIEAHPMASRIQMIEGSSVSRDIIHAVKAVAAGHSRVLVCLDSNHTHEHVLAELEAYAPLASVGSYCVVFDTLIEDMPADTFHDRPWGPGNNPKTAVFEYLKAHPEFVIDKSIDHKLMLTVAPDGFLKRLR